MRETDRELVGLAIPALGALLAEPAFLLADSAIIGHLGTPQLAGLGIASAVLLNAVFLCIFLAHGTTAAVARRAGAGDLRRAYTLGIDGIWLGVSIGLGLAALGIPLAPILVDLLGASATAAPHAVTYLRISLLGLPAMLVVLAATGALRGLKDTRTPLLATGLAAIANVPLNLVLVYPLGLGIAGSAIGTVIAQAAAAAWLCAVVVRGARRNAASLRPDRPGIKAAASANAPLLARTLLLRISLLTMTFVAAAQGDVALAGHQIAFTLWYLLTMPPEAFAIASQAMVGQALGAGESATARAAGRRALIWGLGSGLAMAALLLVLRPAYVPIFTTDAAVRDLVWSLAVVLAASQPIGALLYVLDGILIGAGDTRYLAWTMLVALVVFLPLAGAVLVTEAGVVALWWALTGWLLARQVAVALRFRSAAWLRPGPAA
ncbi:MATE family efflux transporter [Nocardioides gansuensis]|uniref:MATE family efflux transporter n=1 Tax=Nocardioides gansuensis TaxID=2138300 RepID=A0A2T8FBZ1_9ACTN|nr:MATE family efflux transporter [Nocardioides gansuensis]PVG83222.1 MATE family efflux transporter [Nocardioides gansuensis]